MKQCYQIIIGRTISNSWSNFAGSSLSGFHSASNLSLSSEHFLTRCNNSITYFLHDWFGQAYPIPISAKLLTSNRKSKGNSPFLCISKSHRFFIHWKTTFKAEFRSITYNKLEKYCKISLRQQAKKNRQLKNCLCVLDFMFFLLPSVKSNMMCITNHSCLFHHGMISSGTVYFSVKSQRQRSRAKAKGHHNRKNHGCLQSIR